MILAKLALGLVLPFAGRELLVRGSVRFAEGVGISPLAIGLTIVGFGTSMPELATPIQAALIPRLRGVRVTDLALIAQHLR